MESIIVLGFSMISSAILFGAVIVAFLSGNNRRG